MSRNHKSIYKKIILACYAVIITLTIIIITPALVLADNRSNNSQNIFCPEWRTTVGTTMALLKQVINDDNSSNNLTENNVSAEEVQMISLVNQERAKAGLKELKIDYTLERLAKEKSLDMVSHNYFGHISDHLGTLYDQLQQNHVSYQWVAENLAGSINVFKAQRYLFASPIHRWNILNPHFSRIGVGIVRGGPFGAMITQLFLG